MAQSRSPAETARDRVLISRLYLKHKRQDEIAAELNLSQSTVSRDLKALQTLWLEKSIMNIDAVKARELEKIDLLELTYWEAWQSSIGQSVSTTKKSVMRAARPKPVSPGQVVTASQPDVASQELTEYTEKLRGDPRFLAGVMDCIERRCAILGIDAPRKTDVMSGGQKITSPVTMVEIVKQYEKPNEDQ